MNKQQELKDKFYQLSLGVVGLVKLLPKEVIGIELVRQVLKSATSISANYEEATAGFSKADFINKLSIAFKESKETHLWLRLIRDARLNFNDKEISRLIKESEEVANILGRSLKTARSNVKSGKQT